MAGEVEAAYVQFAATLTIWRAGLVRRPDDRVGPHIEDAIGDPLSMVAMGRPVAIASRQIA